MFYLICLYLSNVLTNMHVDLQGDCFTKTLTQNRSYVIILDLYKQLIMSKEMTLFNTIQSI